jgi:glucokinase
VLGLDFGGTKIAAAVAELDGARLATRVTVTAPDRGATENFARGVACARRLLAEEAPRRDLAAVGAATFGLPAPDGVRLSPAIPGWDRLPLEAALREAFDPCPVRVGNDVKAATEAEARAGALRGCDPGLYLNLGTGLAVGIVAGGRVIAGAHGAAGEIAYNLRQLTDLDHPATRVVLEDVVSGMALAAAGTREAGVDLSAADVFADEALAPMLDGFFRELSFHVVNLAIAIDPARIAVGGGMVRSWDRIEPQLRTALEAFVPYPPELVRAAFPYDASLAGAVTLAIEAAHAGAHPQHTTDGHPSTDGHPPADGHAATDRHPARTTTYETPARTPQSSDSREVPAR